MNGLYTIKELHDFMHQRLSSDIDLLIKMALKKQGINEENLHKHDLTQKFCRDTNWTYLYADGVAIMKYSSQPEIVFDGSKISASISYILL